MDYLEIIHFPDELIKAIQNDIDVAKKSLDEASMMKYKEDPFLKS